MKKIYLLVLSGLLFPCIFKSQVGVNTTSPTTTLEIIGKSPSTKVEGILIPKFTGDEIFTMPIPANAAEGNLVYCTAAASTANQTGKGVNLKGKGFFYWDGSVWTNMVSSNTTNNYYSAHIKPMNILLNDSQGITGITSPSGNNLKQFRCNYSASETTESNPLNNFVIWENTTNKINIPQQLLGHAITINISLKYPINTSNAASTRFAAYTGDASVSSTFLYQSGGTKIKDLFFKVSKASSGPAYVRDELVLAPIIVTQAMIDHGIMLFLGESSETYYEPVLTIDFGVVDDTL